MAPSLRIAISDGDGQTSSFSPADSGYSYKPLKTEKHEIRLIQVEPAADPHQAINCNIIHVSLDDAHLHPYRPLSYNWGSIVRSDFILLDGKYVPVRGNLGNALRRLRPKVGTKPLLTWIDAISINQNNNDEKNEQIKLMKRIFQEAETISVWIGSDSATSRSAFKLVRDLNDCRVEDLPGLIWDPTRVEQLEALRQLFYRDYWWRIWVVQEVVVAKSATVYCGVHSISWAELYAVGDRLALVKEIVRAFYHDRPDSVYKLISSGPRALKVPQSSEADQPHLLDLLRSHRSKYSSDPRDKVFGLVGISDIRDSFLIDYSWNTRAVYTYTAKHIISTSRRLDVICVAKNDDNTYGLPSWVPDWTRNDAHTKHRVMGLHIRTPPFAAAGPTFADTEFSEDGPILMAKGIKIDTVKTAGATLDLNQVQMGPHSAPAKPKLHATCETFLQWWALFSSVRGDTVAEQDVFDRTVFGGGWSAAYEPHRDYRLQLFFGGCRALIPEAPVHVPRRPLWGDADEAKSQESIVSAASLRMHGKRLVMDSSDRAGLAPLNTQEGDVICILFGCNFPVVMRPMNNRYMLIGEAYVDDFMNGQAMAVYEAGNYALETFEIQ